MVIHVIQTILMAKNKTKEINLLKIPKKMYHKIIQNVQQFQLHVHVQHHKQQHEHQLLSSKIVTIKIQKKKMTAFMQISQKQQLVQLMSNNNKHHNAHVFKLFIQQLLHHQSIIRKHQP